MSKSPIFQKMLKNIKRQDVLLVITMVLVGYAIFSVNSVEKLTIESNKVRAKEQQKLNKDIDSLFKGNVSIDNKLGSNDSIIKIIKNDVKVNNQKINNIKYETSKRVTDVDNYTNSDLEKFFTERYKK